MAEIQIDHGDQADLIWFFSVGQSAFERSTFGHQLERAELFTFGSKICRRCKGAGFTESPEQAIRRATAELKAWQETRGVKRGAPVGFDDGTCRACLGSGWVPRVSKFQRRGPETARPTTPAARAVPAEPNTDALERYGAVSSRLRRVQAEHRRTLEAYLGVIGGAWADDPNRGRIWGVMPLTPAGQKLAKTHRGKGDSELAPDYALNVAAELQLIPPGDDKQQRARWETRGKLLEAAKEQAERLYAEACAGWVASAGEPRKPRKRTISERLAAIRTKLAGAQ